MFNKLNYSEKQTGFKWNAEEFQLESVISDNHLYLASIEKIYHNGKVVLTNGGFKSKRSTSGEFRDKDGDHHKIELKCYSITDSWLSFAILIDDEIVFKGGTPIKGILTTVAIYIPIIFLLLLLFGKLMGFYLISLNF